MHIRKYKSGDCERLSKLFYDTVHTVNAKDYTKRQLFAWANSTECLIAQSDRLSEQYTAVAEIDGEIVGFGSIDKSGCLDFLFVHKDYQGKGIASALCNVLEKDVPLVKTYASVTAKPFFEKRGYVVVKSQEVERAGVKLINFEMKKLNNRIEIETLTN